MKEISEKEYEHQINNKNNLIGWVKRKVTGSRRIYFQIDESQRLIKVSEILHNLTLTHLDIANGKYEVRCHWKSPQSYQITIKFKK